MTVRAAVRSYYRIWHPETDDSDYHASAVLPNIFGYLEWVDLVNLSLYRSVVASVQQ